MKKIDKTTNNGRQLEYYTENLILSNTNPTKNRDELYNWNPPLYLLVVWFIVYYADVVKISLKPKGSSLLHILW